MKQNTSDDDKQFETTGIDVGAVTEVPKLYMDATDGAVDDVESDLWCRCGREVKPHLPITISDNPLRRSPVFPLSDTRTYRMTFSVIQTRRLHELLEIESMVGGMSALRKKMMKESLEGRNKAETIKSQFAASEWRTDEPPRDGTHFLAWYGSGKACLCWFYEDKFLFVGHGWNMINNKIIAWSYINPYKEANDG